MFQGMNQGRFRAFGKPEVTIFLNGKKMEDWLSFQVDWNGPGDVDSFAVTFQWDCNDTPRHELLYSGSVQSAPLVMEQMAVRIEGGFAGEEKKLWIEGYADYPEWNFCNGETVKLAGRSYAAKPYDYTEAEKYQNLTATEAHAKICGVHGLTPVAPVQTSALIGEYCNEDHASVADDISHWDYIVYLAEQEGFVSRVTGTDWYFGPLAMLEEYQKEPLPFTYGHNVRNLKMKRAPNAARNVKVEVVSWQPGTKNSPGTRIVESMLLGEEKEGANPYTIRRYIPNITREQAQRQVKNICGALQRQQFSGSFVTDYFPELCRDRRIVLYGVGKHLSQTYYVPHVRITGSADRGLECEAEFTNLPEN